MQISKKNKLYSPAAVMVTKKKLRKILLRGTLPVSALHEYNVIVKLIVEAVL